MLRLVLRVIGGSLALVAISLAVAYLYLAHNAPPAKEPNIFLQHGHTQFVEVVAFSPDGHTIASGSADNTIKLWNAATGTLKATLSGHAGPVSSVAFSPDGQTVASGSDDSTIKLWNFSTGTLRASLSGHAGPVSSVAFSPDSQTVVSAGSDDSMIKLWSAATGTLRATMSGHAIGVSSVAFSPDGRTVASGGLDSMIKLWNVATGTLRATLSGHDRGVLSVAFSPDGRTVASGSLDNTIKLWTVPTGALRATLAGHTGPVSSVVFSREGQVLASGSDDKTIKLWSAGTGTLRATMSGQDGDISSVAFSPDGQTVASASADVGTIRLWSVAASTLRASLPGHVGPISSVAFSPDGKTVVSGSADNTIKVWNTATGTLRVTLSGHAGPVSSVAFSPDRQLLASGSDDGTIKLWNPFTGTLRATLDTGPVLSVAFSPDGQTVASGNKDQTIKLWNATTGSLRATLPGHTGPVPSVAFSPDGQTVASGGDDKTVKLWNASTGTLRMSLSGHAGPVSSIAFSPDGQTVASGSDDGTIKLWDAATGALHATLSGHVGGVSSVAFFPDGRTVASGSSDNTIKLWNPSTGALRATLSGHADSVRSIACSPDSKTVASGALDGTVAIWNVEQGKLGALIDPAPGGQYLVLYPGLRYRSSRPEGEPEPAAIRFNGTLDNAYPLQWYSHRLRIPDLSENVPEDPENVRIAPSFIRFAWDQWPNKSMWLFTGSATYAALLTAALVYWRRTDSFQIAKTFLGNAYAGEMQVVGETLLRLGGKASGPAVGILFNASAMSDQVSTKDASDHDVYGKLYVIYADQAPTSAQLAAMRQQNTGQIIPLSSRDMARALAEDAVAAEVLRRLEEPFVARTDPYDEQRPVESELLFFGRSEALQNIPQALLQGQHVGLFGLRKVGKTSLLNRVRDRMANNPCVWIDCQGYEAVALELFQAILNALRKELVRLSVRHIPTALRIGGASDFRAAFLAYFDAWRKRSASGRIVLLFDELDKYFPTQRDASDEAILRGYVSLFRVLRALGQEHQCLSVMAVAYRPDLNRRNLLSEQVGENPMFMGYQEYFLRFLGREDTGAMLRDLGRWKSIEWDNDALGRAYDLSGGHPLLSRMIASDVCERGRRKHVTIVHVEEVGNRIRNSFSRHRVGSYIAESIWHLLRPDERAALSRIARYPGVGVSAMNLDLEDALANLHHFGLLDGDEGGLHLRGELLQAWIERNG